MTALLVTGFVVSDTFWQDTLPLMVLPFFLATWFAALALSTGLSGWGRIAAAYPLSTIPGGTEWRWQTAYFRWSTHYSGCIRVTAGSAGISLVPVLPIRPFHPPFLVPWSDVQARPHSAFFGLIKLVELRFARTPDLPVRIPVELFQRILDVARSIAPDAALLKNASSCR